MTDPISGASVKETDKTPDVDSQALGSEFQSMMMKGGLMFLQSMQSDVTDAINDNTSDPDEPF
ncbi:hypothetical protein [Acetobacter cibinongensis]|uniref:Uncharacterized protein n=1 Tax=Acetobacter cibinongensis TaxID=146475 RepID=A0A1Z5YWL0_9PROT|nr:hypothetical protein [Acetobacter cibinongensis]OUJ03597.1 hypothetical protein HK14_01310 [Acetobacter cibinongensis]GAN59212.1 hypothetical protein Abci_002_089 [Acetobacter cibinongensis]GBQ19281.1 hypothetical protein AA0482_2519 [Acetobacter cibinongensis NRIC 0482]GEL59590.1 hypothetical protein ACI01nite_21920 [Acetobacter cibinongensis]